MDRRIRVLVVDDHAVVRAGVAQVLANAADVVLVGEAANGVDAVRLAEEQAPDVILMDLSMPVLDGIEATRRVRDATDAAQVVVLTSFSDRERILRALDAGAIGYLLKDAEPAELLAGIRAAARGESPLAAKVATAVVEARTQRRPEEELSEREREMLALVAQGLPNKLIARRLEISDKTVKAHLTSVFRQIGVSDRTQAALWAKRHGVGIGAEPPWAQSAAAASS